MAPHLRKQVNDGPAQIKPPLSTILLILALAVAACGGKRGPLTATVPASPASSPTLAPPLSADQPVAAPLLEATPGVVEGGQNLPPMPVDIPYYYPAGQGFTKPRPHRIGLLGRIEDPFSITLVNGGQQAAINLGVELYARLPQNGSMAEQVQMLDGLLARGDLDALLVTAVDVQALMPGLQKAADSGILIVALQTQFAHDAGVVPFVDIDTDERTGGFLACQALAQALAVREVGTEKTPIPPQQVYIQRGNADLLAAGAREQGCLEALAQAADILTINPAQVDNHEDDPEDASQQILTALAETDMDAIICLDAVCSQAAGKALVSLGLSGKVKLAALEATPGTVELLRQGAVDILVTPRPYAMGYLAVSLVTAALDGASGLPARIATGWEVVNLQNMTDPGTAHWVYDSRVVEPQRTTSELKVAFLAGIDDPFYHNMQRGALQAATSLGATLESQYPQNWSADEQIQMVDSMISGGGLNALLLVPTDPLTLIPSLQQAANAGMPVMTLDTALDASFAPLSALSSDHQAGGYFACRSLAQVIGGSGKVYIQSVSPGIAATDARERGCQRALGEYPGITLVAVNYNDDDPAKAQSQLYTILQNFPDLAAVFCTTVLGAQAVGQYLGGQGLSGKVRVAAYDATSATVDLLRNGVIDMVVAQKPADMGYLAVLFAAARLDGITDLPVHISTGFVLLTRANMDDAAYAGFFYTK